MVHIWSEDDDLVGFYLYKYGVSELGVTHGAILKALDIGADSMEAKRLNYQALRTGKGLKNASEQSRMIYQRRRITPKEELKQLVLPILRRKGLDV